MATLSEALSLALQHHQAGRLQEAEALYRQILQVQPNHSDALHLLGVIAHQVGRHDVAVDYINKAIALNPRIAEYHNNLGEAYRVLGKLDKAAAHYQEALTLRPGSAETHNNLGNALKKQGKLEDAVAQYQLALAIRPGFSEAHNNLGVAFKEQGKLDEAVASYRQALALKPGFAEAHNNLGVALKEQGKLDEAVAQYQQALALNPAYAEAYNNLGAVLQDLGKLEEAIAHFQQALTLNPAYAEAYNNLGAAFLEQRKPEEAVAHFRQALVFKPALLEAYTNLGMALGDQSDLEEALSYYQRALTLKPNDGLRILMALMLPPFFKSLDHLRAVRAGFQERVSELLGQDLSLTDPVREVRHTNFWLAYQGLNDRDIQQMVSRMYERACPSLLYVAPHCLVHAQSPKNDKIKIGFISRYLCNHSVALTARGLLAKLSRHKFHVCALLVPPVKNDEMSRLVQHEADQTVLLPNNLKAARERIAEEQLDILFYLDIGMEPFTYFLAFSRLAPVQCVFPGHPVTTGIPAMDYFISSEHLEPKDADLHYSERLVRLKNLPTYYYRPGNPVSTKSRKDFGLDEGRTIYLCPQVFFKFHPDFDELLADILRADPHGEVLLVEGNEKYWTQLLRNRFENAIPDVLGRIRFLPRQSGEDFMRLLTVVDVVLDTLHFGAGSTSLMALGMGAPVVTLPGAYMRSRATYACYSLMGMMDCVVASKIDYVKLAVRLGTDPEYRAEIKAKIQAANGVLYENAETILELERFFLEAVETAHREARARG